MSVGNSNIGKFATCCSSVSPDPVCVYTRDASAIDLTQSEDKSAIVRGKTSLVVPFLQAYLFCVLEKSVINFWKTPLSSLLSVCVSEECSESATLTRKSLIYYKAVALQKAKLFQDNIAEVPGYPHFHAPATTKCPWGSGYSGNT